MAREEFNVTSRAGSLLQACVDAIHRGGRRAEVAAGRQAGRYLGDCGTVEGSGLARQVVRRHDKVSVTGLAGGHHVAGSAMFAVKDLSRHVVYLILEWLLIGVEILGR